MIGRSAMILSAIAALFAASCDKPMAKPEDAWVDETISYEASPCLGPCPAFIVTVSSDGHGVFDGKEYTRVKGRKVFRLTKGEFEAFSNALKPYRPKGVRRLESSPECKEVWTDNPSVEIRWTSKNQTAQLSYYFGCDPEKYKAMAKALIAAPEQGPIKQFIGTEGS